MIPILVWIPAATSLVLGLVYLFSGDAKPIPGAVGIFVFVSAVYLQFFTRFPLFGLLLQIALAVSLALWRKMDAPT